MGFEPEVSASERQQTYALERAANGIGVVWFSIRNSCEGSEKCHTKISGSTQCLRKWNRKFPVLLRKQFILIKSEILFFRKLLLLAALQTDERRLETFGISDTYSKKTHCLLWNLFNPQSYYNNKFSVCVFRSFRIKYHRIQWPSKPPYSSNIFRL